jgi:hypothetical protein
MHCNTHSQPSSFLQDSRIGVGGTVVVELVGEQGSQEGWRWYDMVQHVAVLQDVSMLSMAIHLPFHHTGTAAHGVHCMGSVHCQRLHACDLPQVVQLTVEGELPMHVIKEHHGHTAVVLLVDVMFCTDSASQNSPHML